MRTLIIGFGNPSRRDDGVGLAVVNGLRSRLGLPLLDETMDGFDDLGQDFDTLFLQQLTPELAETLAEYNRVIFVDAHIGSYPELIHRQSLDYEPPSSLVSHHIKPGRLVALAKQLFGGVFESELISIRGFDFNFGSELSPDTARGVESVVEDIWQRDRPA